MKLNKFLIIIALSIVPCSLYPFNSVTTRHALQPTWDLLARPSALPQFVAASMCAHKYVSATALIIGALLLVPPTRRVITDFLADASSILFFSPCAT